MTTLRKIEKFLVSAYANRFFIFYITALLWLPFTRALAQDSSNTPFISAIVTYKGEVIIIGCLAALAVGSLLAVKYNPPLDVPESSRMDRTTRFFFGISGGVAAFLYVLDEKQMLTLLHPLWVLGVSIVTPSFFQIAFPVIVRVWYRFVKNKAGDTGNE